MKKENTTNIAERQEQRQEPDTCFHFLPYYEIDNVIEAITKAHNEGHLSMKGLDQIAESLKLRIRLI